MDTLKASFRHIGTTLDATCVTVRAAHEPSSSASLSSSSASSSAQLNTSLSRILTDHHRIRGSALRCLMTALDIDRLAIDKAHRHIALLHGAGQHREAEQAERAVRGYPPLLEVLHVVMEKNGVEEWDRWARRESTAQRDETLGRYVPFPITARALQSPGTQPLPAPISHLLPTLAERQVYDDPPSSPPHSPPRTLPPPLPAQHNGQISSSAARPQANGQQQPARSSSDSQPLNVITKLQHAIEADDRAKAERLAARRVVDRQKRAEKKRKAEAEVVLDENEEIKQNKEEAKRKPTPAEVPRVLKEHKEMIAVDDEVDAEVQQLTATCDGAAGEVELLDGSLPTETAQPLPPLRPQLLAGASQSLTSVEVSPVNGLDHGSAASPSSSSHSLLPRLDGALSPDFASSVDYDVAHSSLSLSGNGGWPSSFASTDQHQSADGNHASSSSQSGARPVRNRKKAPRYGEDDLCTPEPQAKQSRPLPRKPTEPRPPPPPRSPSPEPSSEPVYEIERLYCYRLRTFPPNHEQAGDAYRSFLVAWKNYPRATWVMEDDLVSVDRASLERLTEYDDWRVLPGNEQVEVEEEELWEGGGEDSASKQRKKRRRGTPLSKQKRKH